MPIVPEAFLNGRFIPATEACIPIDDAGFALGATVTEQLRTFNGRLFRLEDHLDRLGHSLEIAGIVPRLSLADIRRVAEELIGRNHPLARPGSDLGMVIFVTPGPQPALSGPTRADRTPLVGLHTFELPFPRWAEKYRLGERLVITDIRQVPASCWPPELKCRSRMHYFLADSKAAAIEPGARALLLDDRGQVAEASTANVLICPHDGGLVTPPADSVLHGISLAETLRLAEGLDMPISQRAIGVDDVAAADEVLLTSTPFCILAVTRLNGDPVGTGRPGAIYRRLLRAWNDVVGLDIAAQALGFAGG